MTTQQPQRAEPQKVATPPVDHDAFARLLDSAKRNEAIIGLFLRGSRGKAFHEPGSDYDVTIVVKSREASPYPIGYSLNYRPGIDLFTQTLDEFRTCAAWMGPEHWARYSFAHVTALIDRSGEIQRLIEEKSLVPQDVRESFVEASIDAYLNAFYRSIKCRFRGNRLGGRLHASLSIPHLLDALFAIEGRVAPYPDYVERELMNYPLSTLAWTSNAILSAFRQIAETGSGPAQQELARFAADHFQAGGFAHICKGWGPDMNWAMSVSVL